MLRLSEKRSLTQMNAFDFIVTVAIGSTLANVILSKDTTLMKGLIGLGLLILLQFIVSWISVRLTWFSELIKSELQLFFYQEAFKEKAMPRECIKKEKLLQAARNKGILFLDQIEAIVLETNGKFSIIRTASQVVNSTLQNVKKEYFK